MIDANTPHYFRRLLEAQEKRPLFVVVTGGSAGVGKDTVMKHLIDRGFQRVVTANTRQPRPGEKDGVDYHFLDMEKFKQWIEEGKLLEYEEVTGTLRGTPKAAITEPLSQGKSLVIRVEPKGARTIKEHFPEAIVVFIAVSRGEIMRRRMRERGEDADFIERRIALAVEEGQQVFDADYVVFNEEGKLTDALAQIDAIVEAERRRMQRGYRKK